MSHIRPLTDETFAETIRASEKTVLVEFWAEWCGPCRALAPILEQVAAEHPDTVDLYKINADDNQKTAAEYKAMALPMLKVIQHGEVVKTIIGAKPKPAIEMELAGLI